MNLVEHVKRLSIVSGGQLIIQFLAFLIGIGIVRILSISEYALFTVVLSLWGAMSALADGGVNSGVLSEGGKVWQDPKKLGAVLLAGVHIRRFLLTGVTVFFTPILCYLLYRNNIPLHRIGFLIAIALALFYVSVQYSFYTLPLQLHQKIRALQSIDIRQNLIRGSLVILCLFILPYVEGILIASVIAQCWALTRLRKATLLVSDTPEKYDPAAYNNITHIVTRSLPGNVYYACQGQLTIWLLTIFGTTASIAQVGALGRFGQIIALLSSVFSIYFIPRFSRIPQNAPKLRSVYLLILGSIFTVCFILFSLTYCFPHPILSILGPKYHDLSKELMLFIASTSLAFCASSAYSLSASRGVLLKPLISLPALILVQILLICTLPLTTVTGVLWMSIIMSISQGILSIFYFSKNVK